MGWGKTGFKPACVHVGWPSIKKILAFLEVFLKNKIVKKNLFYGVERRKIYFMREKLGSFKR